MPDQAPPVTWVCLELGACLNLCLSPPYSLCLATHSNPFPLSVHVILPSSSPPLILYSASVLPPSHCLCPPTSLPFLSTIPTHVLFFPCLVPPFSLPRPHPQALSSTPFIDPKAWGKQFATLVSFLVLDRWKALVGWRWPIGHSLDNPMLDKMNCLMFKELGSSSWSKNTLSRLPVKYKTWPQTCQFRNLSLLICCTLEVYCKDESWEGKEERKEAHCHK